MTSNGRWSVILFLVCQVLHQLLEVLLELKNRGNSPRSDDQAEIRISGARQIGSAAFIKAVTKSNPCFFGAWPERSPTVRKKQGNGWLHRRFQVNEGGESLIFAQYTLNVGICAQAASHRLTGILQHIPSKHQDSLGSHAPAHDKREVCLTPRAGAAG